MTTTTVPEVQTRLRELVSRADLPLEPPRFWEPQRPGVPADPFMRVRTTRTPSVSPWC